MDPLTKTRPYCRGEKLAQFPHGTMGLHECSGTGSRLLHDIWHRPRVTFHLSQCRCLLVSLHKMLSNLEALTCATLRNEARILMADDHKAALA